MTGGSPAMRQPDGALCPRPRGLRHRLATVRHLREEPLDILFPEPLDEQLLLELAETHSRIITLEEHSLAGGFGSAVVEFLNDRGIAVPVERVGVPNVLVHHAKPEAQRAQFGLTGEAVAARVRALAPTQTA